LALAAVVFIVLIAFLIGRIKKARLRARIDEIISNGRYTLGQIVAVQASCEITSSVSVYLSYREPDTGNSKLERHLIDVRDENVPVSVESTGTGNLDGSLREFNATVGGPDKYGFVKLAEPVDVDVYLHDAAPTRDGIHVVFKKLPERVLKH
jgi:hypothetical protein